MKDFYVLLLIFAVVATAVGSLTVTTLISKKADIEQKEKDRAAYVACIALVERLLKEDPKRVSLPYCSK